MGAGTEVGAVPPETGFDRVVLLWPDGVARGEGSGSAGIAISGLFSNAGAAVIRPLTPGSTPA